LAKLGCTSCHVETIVSGKDPAAPGGPGLHPDTLENRTIHPNSDFLLRDVGTGDGIPIALVEHFGRKRIEKRMRELVASRAAEAKQRQRGKTEHECRES
jgi:hypothetical protein